MTTQPDDDASTVWCKNVTNKFNPLRRVHQPYKRQTDRQTTDIIVIPIAERDVVTFGY